MPRPGKPRAMPNVTPMGIASGNACARSPRNVTSGTDRTTGDISKASTILMKTNVQTSVRLSLRRSSSAAIDMSSAQIAITLKTAT